jgi:hypothetical protein
LGSKDQKNESTTNRPKSTKNLQSESRLNPSKQPKKASVPEQSKLTDIWSSSSKKGKAGNKKQVVKGKADPLKKPKKGLLSWSQPKKGEQAEKNKALNTKRKLGVKPQTNKTVKSNKGELKEASLERTSGVKLQKKKTVKSSRGRWKDASLSLEEASLPFEEGIEMVPFLNPDGIGGLLIVKAGECVMSETPKPFMETEAQKGRKANRILEETAAKSKIATKSQRSTKIPGTQGKAESEKEAFGKRSRSQVTKPQDRYASAEPKHEEEKLMNGFTMFKVRSAKTVARTDGESDIIFSDLSAHSSLSSLTKRTY